METQRSSGEIYREMWTNPSSSSAQGPTARPEIFSKPACIAQWQNASINIVQMPSQMMLSGNSFIGEYLAPLVPSGMCSLSIKNVAGLHLPNL